MRFSSNTVSLPMCVSSPGYSSRSIDEQGKPLVFVGLTTPAHGAQALGKGSIVHRPYVGQEEPECESLESVALVSTLISANGNWHVRLSQTHPVSWQTWGTGGGVTNAGGNAITPSLDRIKQIDQPRLLASAILHQSANATDFPVLFVLNCYPEPAELTVTFKDLRPKFLRHLVSKQDIPVINGVAQVDIDRKSGEVYALVMNG